MDRIQMQVEKRNIGSKSLVKQIRAEGKIPAVVYGKGTDSGIPVSVNYAEFIKFLHHHHWENTLIDLDIVGEDGKKESHLVLVHEIEHHPVSDKITHVDFLKVSLEDKIRVYVPVVARGEPVGVKKGGILEHMVWEIEVECLPTQIPDEIAVDVSSLDIGDSLHVSDVIPPEGVRILEDGDVALFVVEYSGGGQQEEESREVSEVELVKKKEEEEK